MTAVPRSGTHFTAALLQAMGRDIRHEDVGRDGASSWLHITNGIYHVPERDRTKTVSNQGFSPVLHQVRQPLKVISSMQTLRQCSWDYLAQHSKVDRKAPIVVQAMQAWIGWNELIAARADWRFQVEQLEAVFPEFLKRAGLPAQPYPVLAHSARESRVDRYVPLGWEHLLYHDRALTERVAALAVSYGYSVPDLTTLQATKPPFSWSAFWARVKRGSN